MDWLFAKYNNDDMTFSDSNGDEEDETLTGFMPLHLDEMDSLAS